MEELKIGTKVWANDLQTLRVYEREVVEKIGKHYKVGHPDDKQYMHMLYSEIQGWNFYLGGKAFFSEEEAWQDMIDDQKIKIRKYEREVNCQKDRLKTLKANKKSKED